jgi:hypothetical protein
MKYLQYSFLLFLLFNFFTSCDKFVDVPLPDSQMTGELVFEDEKTVNAAMAGLYAKVRDNGLVSGGIGGPGYIFGLYADEFDLATSAANEIYQNSITPTTGIVENTWNFSYNQIYNANIIAEGVVSSKKLSQAYKDQIQGETFFLRAMTHFYLVNIFASIPYIETTDYVANSQVTKLSVDDIYGKIIADLIKAESLLSEPYITAGRFRPNKFTATALLARVYLYRGSWSDAAKAASRVINSPIYQWESDLSKVFLVDCAASIWQLDPGAAGANSNEGSFFIATAAPPEQVSMTTELVNAFTAGDLRKQAWTGTVSNATHTFFFPYKYKERLPTASTKEVSVAFRLAEQYLIRAEALARTGSLDSSRKDLDRIRTTAGLTETTASTQDELVDAILKERRLELFSEQGHRFFDLKRLSLLNTTLTNVKPGWNSRDALWPIPAVELKVNPNLKPQNFGY